MIADYSTGRYTEAGAARAEEIIKALPWVVDCRVELRGQGEFACLAAYIVPAYRNGVADRVVRDLECYCRTHLAPEERPRVFAFADTLSDALHHFAA